jgi:hypothetical protein
MKDRKQFSKVSFVLIPFYLRGKSLWNYLGIE